jgi:cell division protein FtsZ
MVKGITETISLPSLINLDYADVRTILTTGGVAIVGVGESCGDENRVDDAIFDALNSPLLDVDISGARGALIHICGGNDMTLAEANSVAAKISHKMDVNDSMVIWGARVSDEFEGYLRVMLLITGIKSPQIFGSQFDRNKSENYKPKVSKEKIGLSDEIFNIEELSYD